MVWGDGLTCPTHTSPLGLPGDPATETIPIPSPTFSHGFPSKISPFPVLKVVLTMLSCLAQGCVPAMEDERPSLAGGHLSVVGEMIQEPLQEETCY